MDIHPLLFDRHKTLILEPLVGHAGLSSQSPSQMPGAFTADRHEDGRLEIRAQLQEFSHLGACIALLFPVAHAHPPPQPWASLCCANLPGD